MCDQEEGGGGSDDIGIPGVDTGEPDQLVLDDYFKSLRLLQLLAEESSPKNQSIIAELTLLLFPESPACKSTAAVIIGIQAPVQVLGLDTVLDAFHGILRESCPNCHSLLNKTTEYGQVFIGRNEGFPKLILLLKFVLRLIQIYGHRGGLALLNPKPDHLQWFLLARLAEIWAHRVRTCSFETKFKEKLPFKDVSAQFANVLSGFWQFRQILDIRRKFSQVGLQILTSFNTYDDMCGDLPQFLAKWHTFSNSEDLSNLRDKDVSDFSNIVTTFLAYFLGRAEVGERKGAGIGKRKVKGGRVEYSSVEMRKDLISLRRSLRYIDLGLGEDGRAFPPSLANYVCERGLQVVGESLKATAETQNLSVRTAGILAKGGVPLEELQTLRNLFSHSSGLMSRRRRSSEKRRDLSSIAHKELLKLRRIISQVLRRCEFKWLKEMVVRALRGRGAGFDGKEIHNLDDLEAVLKECPELKNLVHQTRVQSELEQMDISLDSKDRRKVEQVGVDGWSLQGKGISKSTITQVSAFVGIKDLKEQFSLRHESAPKGVLPSSQSLEELVDQFKRIALKSCPNQKTCEELASSLGLGVEYNLDMQMLENELEWNKGIREDEETQVKELLQLLNKVTYLANCHKTQGHAHSSNCDALMALFQNAREGVILVKEQIQAACEAMGIYHLTETFIAILQEMSTNDEIDNQIDIFVDQVVAVAKTELVNVDLESQVRCSREFLQSKEKLANFMEAKSKSYTFSLNEAGFDAHYQILSDNLAKFNKPPVKFKCNFHTPSGNANWNKDKTLLSRTVSSYEGLRVKLKSKRSLQGSCSVFSDYLKSLGISGQNQIQILSIFEFQEKSRLEAFVVERIEGLKECLGLFGILDALEEGEALRILKTEPRIQAVLEILVLDSNETLSQLFTTPSSHVTTDPILEPIRAALLSVLGTNSLRNYLAHGDFISDVLNPSDHISNAILANATRLVNHGAALLALKRLVQNNQVRQELGRLVEENQVHAIHNQNPAIRQQNCQNVLETFQENPQWQEILASLFSDDKEAFPAFFQSSESNEKWSENYQMDLEHKLWADEALHAVVTREGRKLKSLLLPPNNGLANYKFEHGWTLLHFAVSNFADGPQILETLIEAGGDVNSGDELGTTPLHLAILLGNALVLDSLLQVSNLDLNPRDSRGMTPLHVVSLVGDEHMLQSLLERGAEPNVVTRNSGLWTPLHLAVGCGHVEVVEALLKWGASPHANAAGRWTPLHLAMTRKYKGQGHRIVESLLNAKADVHAVLEDTRAGGNRAPIHVAACFGNTKGVAALLGLHPEAVTSATPGGRFGKRQTALHFAARFGWQETVELLVGAGAKIELLDDENCSPLAWAMRTAHFHVAQFLIQRGALVNPLFVISAAVDGDVRMVEFMVEKCGVDLSVRTPLPGKGYNALECSSLAGHLEVFKYIFASTTPPIDDPGLRHLFLLAVSAGKSNVVQHIADMGKIDFKGSTWGTTTPLHVSATHGRLALTKYLIENCSQIQNLKSANAKGSTPALAAARNKHWSVVSYLTDEDIMRQFAQETQALTPAASESEILTLAAQEGQWGLVKRLVTFGWDFRKANVWTDPVSGQEMTPAPVPGIAGCKCNLLVLQHIVERGFDVQELVSPSYLKDLFQSTNSNILHYLKSKGLDFGACAVGADLESGLHIAAAAENLSVCQFFLFDLKFDPLSTTKSGLTALHSAVLGRSVESVKYLIQHDAADLSARTGGGETGLDVAIRTRSDEIIKILLEKASLPLAEYVDGKRNTVLHLYCNGMGRQGSMEMVKYLLEGGVDPQLQNSAGETVLHLLVRSERVDLIKLILLSKPTQTLKVLLNSVNKDGNSPALLAVQQVITKYKQNQKARIPIPEFFSPKRNMAVQVLEFLLEFKPDLNIRNGNMETALHLAVKSGIKEVELVNYLLADFGSDPFLRDKEERTARDWAAITNGDEDRLVSKLSLYECDFKVQILKDERPLLELKAKQLLYCTNQIYGNGALHLAISTRNLRQVELILKECPADQLVPNSMGRLPIHEAAVLGNVDILHKLIGPGSDVNARTKDTEWTPLHFSARYGQLDSLNTLLQAGADPSLFNSDGQKPVHVAIWNNRMEIVEYLFTQNISHLNDRDEFGRSPLLVAAEAGRRGIVEYFLERVVSGEDEALELLKDYKVLVMGILSQDLPTFQYLLSKGALAALVEVGAEKCPKSPLRLAIVNHQWEMAKLLLSRTSSRETELLLRKTDAVDIMAKACREGELGILELLLAKGLDPNQFSEEESSGLMAAVQGGQLAIVQHLLQHTKVNPNAYMTSDQKTALHVAAELGFADIIRVLLTNHSASSFKSRSSLTPLAAAANNKMWAAVDVLLESGEFSVHDLSSLDMIQYSKHKGKANKP